MAPLSAQSIENFLSGNATPDEKAQIEAWYQSCQEQKSLTESLTKEEQEETAARMWETISKAVQAEQDKLSKTCG